MLRKCMENMVHMVIVFPLNRKEITKNNFLIGLRYPFFILLTSHSMTGRKAVCYEDVKC